MQEMRHSNSVCAQNCKKMIPRETQALVTEAFGSTRLFGCIENDTQPVLYTSAREKVKQETGYFSADSIFQVM